MDITLKQGDCLELMKDIPDNSVDMILCDPPYGITGQNKWDKVIDIDAMWAQYKRIIKSGGGDMPIFKTALCLRPNKQQSQMVPI